MNEFLIDGFGAGAFLAFQTHLLQGPELKQDFGPAVLHNMISPGGVGIAEFISILDDGAYSAVFHDGAVVILQCRFAGDALSAHRYSYIPCPVDQNIINGRPDEVELADWLRDLMADPSSDAFRSRGTYRFDFVLNATVNQDDPHPISHLTFGSPACRMPVRAPLSPGNFFDILFQNFYRPYLPLWEPISPHLRCNGIDDTITAAELITHHLSWRDAA